MICPLDELPNRHHSDVITINYPTSMIEFGELTTITNKHNTVLKMTTITDMHDRNGGYTLTKNLL